jgi:hypothetical protein
MQNSSELLEEIQGLSDATEPTEKRYKTSDCTTEKWVELLSVNPRGLLYFRDELVGLFRRMDKPGYEQDRAFLIESWSGNGEHTDDRIGRGTTRAENLCISMLGSIQPGKFAGYLRQALSNEDNDGFVQRLQLMVYPDMPKFEYRDMWPDVESKNRCYEIVKKLAYWDFKGDPFEEDDAGPFLRFDDNPFDSAQEVFEQWFMDLQGKIESEDAHPAFVEHLGKYRSLMPSLALIFHLIEIADGTGQGAISKRCAVQAAAWCDYLESHARRIYGMVLDGAAIAAAALSIKIKAGGLKSPFKIRTIQQKGWGRLTDNAEIREAVLYLADKGWVREKEPDQKRWGRQAEVEYGINPKVFSGIR